MLWLSMNTLVETANLKAFNDSIRRPTPLVVDDLRKILGAKLVAYIAGVTETRTVREWAEAIRSPAPSAEERLRLAHRIATLIGQSEGEQIVPTWFQGMNPLVGDRVPARMLREDDFSDVGPQILEAAKAFVGV